MCTFSTEVKPVHFVVTFTYIEQGGQGHYVKPGPTKARHNGGCNLGSQIVYLQHEHGHCDQTMFGWGPSWFLFQAVASN